MIKIAVAVTGASGSIYAKVLLEQLQRLKEQVSEVSVVWSDNAFTVWQHELGNEDYRLKYGTRMILWRPSHPAALRIAHSSFVHAAWVRWAVLLAVSATTW
jgi:3-polyprenyl-4-hydroxybenzoate decarboxylase